MPTACASDAEYIDTGTCDDEDGDCTGGPTFSTPTTGSTYAQRLSTLEAHRKELWGYTAGDWEIWYNGYDSPADRVRTAFVWDNPIDDDGVPDYPLRRGFQLNTIIENGVFKPAPGYLSINRNTECTTILPTELMSPCKPLGSVISRRDEVLRKSDGFTLELGVKIHPPTAPLGLNDNSFNAYYRMDDGTVIGLFLSQTELGAGGYSQHRLGFAPGNKIPFDTTKAYNIYRLVQQPGSNTFAVYVNGVHKLNAVGSSALIPVTSVRSDDKFPMVIIGGEKGSTTTAFTLDFVRYRRGAFAPGAPMTPARTRTPPKLPPPLPTGAHETWKSFPSATLGPAISWWPITEQAPTTRPYEFSSLKPARRTAAIGTGLPNKGAITIEARIKVMPDSEHRGFSLYLRDHMGTLGFLLSPDKAELAVGIKNVGFYKDIPIGMRKALVDTTDGYHTYRIVRPANSFYAYLYIDNDPIPALYDQHLDASQSGFFGQAAPAIVFGDTLNNWGKAHVMIDYIRWTYTAYAPPVPM
ncbi:MAG TPA: hypothetical protein VIV11_23960 [Kofleriaceae bacterium]